MAQRFAEVLLKTTHANHGHLGTIELENISETAYALADYMQTEADKRKITAPDEIPKHERLIPFDELHEHDYIYGRICACGAVNGAEEEWQPDWSQAPENAEGWRMYKDGKFGWLYNAKYMGSSALTYSCEAPSFNYQGDWQDSLRKRPQ